MKRAEQRPERALSQPAIAVQLAAVALAAFSAWHALELDYRGDDAAITFRYVQNLLDGHGPVFNPGERVEGYSSFLWLVVLSGLARLVDLDLAALARGTGAALGAVAVLLVHRLSLRLVGPRPESLLAPLLLALSTPFATWAGGGLETPLFAVLVLGAALARTESDLPAAGIWLGLCALARPEGLLLGAAALGFETLRLIRARERAVASALARLALPIALAVAPHLAFRRLYYGEWVPNTYFAKVEFDLGVALRGVGYLQNYVGLVSALPVLLALIGVALARRQEKLAYPALFSIVYLAWIVLVGGDGLVMYRFVAHVLPLLCLLAATALLAVVRALERALCDASAHLPRLPRPSTRATAFFSASLWGALSGLLALSAGWPSALLLLRPNLPWTYDAASDLYFPNVARHGYRWFDQYFSERVARAGRFLDLHALPHELVAANAAGIGAHLRQPVLDMLGLNDRTIARGARPKVPGRAGHERGDGAYVLARKPAYVLLGNVALLPEALDDRGVEQRLYLRSEHELWSNPAFHRDYERVVLELSPHPPHRYFTFYRRRDAAFKPGEGRGH